MQIGTTSKFIEDLIDATPAGSGDMRQQYVLRQALHGLVRQARAEQMFEIKRNVARLSGLEAMAPRRRQIKAILKGIELACDWRQQQFEFDGGDNKAS
ncbi:MAG: hypothetical protein V4582_21345 [Pseudomonadota bacterium]